MIASVSTLLGRAMRRRNLALLCSVSNHELLEAALSVQQKDALILVVKASLRTSPEQLHALLASAVWRVQHHESSFGILLDLGMWEPAERQKFLTELHGFPPMAGLIYPGLTFPRGWELIGPVWGRITADGIREAVSEKGLVAVGVRVSSIQDRKGAIALEEVKNLHKAARVPLFLEESSLSPRMLRQLAKAGVSGVCIDEQLEEAFTAGLRAGMRNRTLTQPELYFRKGRLAVVQRISTYLTHLIIK